MSDEEFLKYKGKLALPKRLIDIDSSDLELITENVNVVSESSNYFRIRVKCLRDNFSYYVHTDYIKHHSIVFDYNQTIVDMFLNKETMDLAIEIIKNDYRNTTKVALFAKSDI